jgi:hypothetical protein
VRQNIDFSRIAVRNNHAITETLMLYIFGTLFPEAPDAGEWRENGKRWFEEEITYQIYADGSYLQFSMNYHRVAVQLLTLAIRFAEKAGEKFSPTVYQRARASLSFLQFFQDSMTGRLPNYGNNDGALFFKFSGKNFRDYRPQLEALALALGQVSEPEYDDGNWYGRSVISLREQHAAGAELRIFPEGGFAGMRRPDSLLFFRCGKHRDRPSQADNLHVDLWYKGQNILRDAGTYKYNASQEDIRFFFGTESHNAVMLDGADQMLKGPRFVWLNWSQALNLTSSETKETQVLNGEISAFRHLSKGIRHRRKIQSLLKSEEWHIEDSFFGADGRNKTILWHPGPDFNNNFRMEVRDEAGVLLEPETREGWYSDTYGQKEPALYWAFSTKSSFLSTQIIKRNPE